MYENHSMRIKTIDAFHIAWEAGSWDINYHHDRLVQIYNQDTTQFLIGIQNSVHLLEEDYENECKAISRDTT